MTDRRPARRRGGRPETSTRSGRTGTLTRSDFALARLSVLVLLVVLALLVGVAGPATAGFAAADRTVAPGSLEQRGADERVEPADERSRSAHAGGFEVDREWIDGSEDDFALARVDLRGGLPAAPSGIVLRHLMAVLLAGTLLGGLSDRLTSASKFVSEAKLRLIRSASAVAPDRRFEGRKRTETVDDDASGDAPRSDEEIVRELLAQRGGRMQQSDIVEETEWSKAKVSRLLGEMEDAGEIVKVPIGRQNLIYLDGAEPEITKPTHGSH